MTDRDRDLPEGAADIEEAPPGEEAAQDRGGGGTQGAPEGSPAGDEKDRLREELEDLRRRYMYLAAEFDNYRKRMARETEERVLFGNERLLRAILPVLDNFERAMAQEGSGASAESILSGVRMTYDQLLAELAKFGLEQVSAAGKAFDPALHEAVARVPWEGTPEGTVLTEERKGYLLRGRLLRPAQVTVAIRPQEAAPAAGGGDGSDAAGGGEG